MTRPQGAIAIGASITVIAIAAITIAASRAPRPPPSCAGVAAKAIEAAWSDARSDGIRRAFVATGSPRADATADRVAKAFAAYAARWSAMRAAACEAANDAQGECLDQRARELDATAALLEKANAKLVDDAVTAASGLGDLEACTDDATLRSEYATPSDPAARARVEAIRARLAEGTALLDARKLDDAATALAHAAMDAKAAADPQLEGAALLALGRTDIARGEAKVATGELLQAATRAAAVQDSLTEASAWIWLVRAAGYDLGDVASAERYAGLAEAAMDRAGRSSARSALRADLVRHRAHVFYARGDLDHAEPLYREALALRAKAYGAASPELAVVEMDLADVTSAQGHLREGIAMYEKAIARRAEAYGEGNPALVTVLSNAAKAYVEIGDAAGAIRTAKRALAATREEDSAHAHAKVALASALLLQGDDAAATTEASEALDEFARVRGADSWLTAEAHDDWAMTLARRHHDDAALREADVAIASLAAGSAAPDELRVARQLRALSLARVGRVREAIPEATSALADEERARGATSASLLVPLLALGEASLGAKDAARAIAPLERAVTIGETAEGFGELRADARVDLARALLATHGDAARARDLAERAARDFDDLRLADQAKAARALR